MCKCICYRRDSSLASNYCSDGLTISALNIASATLQTIITEDEKNRRWRRTPDLIIITWKRILFIFQQGYHKDVFPSTSFLHPGWFYNKNNKTRKTRNLAKRSAYQTTTHNKTAKHPTWYKPRSCTYLTVTRITHIYCIFTLFHNSPTLTTPLL